MHAASETNMKSHSIMDVRKAAEDSFSSGVCVGYTGKAAEIAARILAEAEGA
jgi:hypothetical protein